MTERRFNLIKTDIDQQEKRLLPRFPISYLTFKPEQGARAYEVKDISTTGMQLNLKEGNHVWSEGERLQGTAHWLGHSMELQGKVMWVSGQRVGVEFVKRAEMAKAVGTFLTEERLVEALRPLHLQDYGVELPAQLKYWLRADGPVEIFIWQHSDGELSRFQVLLLENFVEWQDGAGLKTGRIMSKRSVDTPLLDEDELLFRVDTDFDSEKLARVRSLVEKIPHDLLAAEAKAFMLLKLG